MRLNSPCRRCDTVLNKLTVSTVLVVAVMSTLTFAFVPVSRPSISRKKEGSELVQWRILDHPKHQRYVVGSLGDTRPSSSSSSTSNKNSKRRRPREKNQILKDEASKSSTSTDCEPETWRFYGIKTHPDEDDWYQLQREQQQDKNRRPVEAPKPTALIQALSKRLRIDLTDDQIQVVRRSLDARRKLEHPSFHYVVDVTLTPVQLNHNPRLREKPGQVERMTSSEIMSTKEIQRKEDETGTSTEGANAKQKKKVLVVGAGPAGLFCALQLALSGQVEPILLDRGQPVERRGRDIGALIHRSQLNPESNFAFGEGGAGTWSDGKLTTRIGRNSANVRWILETLVEYGAPANILWEGAPHLGTDNLVRLLRNMRHDLEDRLGTTIHFGARLTNIQLDPDTPCVVSGIQVERTMEDGTSITENLRADAVVVATGHSARDVYETLAKEHSQSLEPKGFATGFRIEHPQKLITKIQYGEEWGLSVITGKKQTDNVNQEYFSSVAPEDAHPGQLPVPSYRLATDKANDGLSSDRLRGVYSFCMCPGGQIVLSSTNSSEICVNGMSFSKRDSQWANSALVVTVFPDDPILEPYREKFGVMAGVEFQRDMERRAAEMGGGKDLIVPVQRVTDFIEGKVSETIPSSSYRLGVRSSACHEIYPAPITKALRDALVNFFDKQMPGYVHEDGLLHAVETRTSSPLRISRDAESFQAKGLENLFPAGEGAGFAGGIVSAAVDGRLVAEAVLDHFFGSDRPGKLQKSKGKGASVGFNY